MVAVAEPRVPPLTQEKLRTEHAEGTRHQAKLDLAMSLLGNGIPPEAVAATLRQKFPFAADREIEGVMDWATEHDPQPSGGDHYHGGNGHRKPENFMRGRFRPDSPSPGPRKPDTPLPATETLRRLKDWLGDATLSEDDLSYASVIKPSGTLATDATLLFESLYGERDLINIVCKYSETTTAEGRNKANPHGPGRIASAGGWINWFADRGVPVMRAGTWVRPNPVTSEIGSGKGGAVMDADIKAHRFLLLESDCLPLQVQLTAMAVFKLPIAVIMTSGGASYHAWVKVDCENAQQYEHAAERILSAVEPFGFDRANKNPSRLSRLPGVMREIRHGEGDGRQRLVYLNPEPEWKAIV
jgi:hypothetical protein